jgi:hypothetical protein
MTGMMTSWRSFLNADFRRKLEAHTSFHLLSIALVLVFSALSSVADQIEMQNGDRYAGKVLSLDTNQVVMQSDVLGKVTLPRSKIASLTLGSGATAPLAKPSTILTNQSAAVAITNGSADLAAAFRKSGTNQQTVKQIREQYLIDAGPEANAKFDELLGGVMSGKVSINDLRAQAKSAADQLRGFKRDLGDEAGSELDGYLAILDHFLQETGSGGVTNSAAPARKLKPALPSGSN